MDEILSTAEVTIGAIHKKDEDDGDLKFFSTQPLEEKQKENTDNQTNKDESRVEVSTNDSKSVEKTSKRKEDEDIAGKTDNIVKEEEPSEPPLKKAKTKKELEEEEREKMQ